MSAAEKAEYAGKQDALGYTPEDAAKKNQIAVAVYPLHGRCPQLQNGTDGPDGQAVRVMVDRLCWMQYARKNIRSATLPICS